VTPYMASFSFWSKFTLSPKKRAVYGGGFRWRQALRVLATCGPGATHCRDLPTLSTLTCTPSALSRPCIVLVPCEWLTARILDATIQSNCSSSTSVMNAFMGTKSAYTSCRITNLRSIPLLKRQVNHFMSCSGSNCNTYFLYVVVKSHFHLHTGTSRARNAILSTPPASAKNKTLRTRRGGI
jgi:hypothetical protein